jgi:hypothetical protein
MDNCTYNKMKLLKDLALIDAFIGRHGKKDAKSAKHNGCEKMLEQLQRDIQKHMKNLKTVLAESKL